MSTSLPDPIHLGYRVWRIKYDQGCADEEYGETVANKGLILISPGQDGPAEVDTVIHECLHAMMHNTGNVLKHKEEEQVVTLLAHGIVELMQRNPHLMEWCYERLRGV